MAIHIIRSIKKSFATRLSLQIVTFAALMLLVSNSVIRMYSSEAVIQEADEQANDKLKIATSKLKNAMSKIAIETYDDVWPVVRNANDTAALANGLREQLRLTPEASGCAMIFVPEHKGDTQLFAYCYRGANGVNTVIRSGDFDFTTKPWFKKTIESGEQSWTDPYLNHQSMWNNIKEEHVITYYLPVKSRKRVIGVFTIDMPIQWFSRLVNEVKAPKNWHIILIASDGTIISHPDKENLLKNISELTDKHTYGILKSIKRKESGKFQTKFNGEDYCVYYKRLKKTGWVVTVVCSEQDLMQEHTLLTRRINIVIVSCLIIMLVFSIWLIRRNVKPLTDLAKAAEKIAGGDFDATTPEMDRSDEMGQLSKSFANMQRSLNNHIEELKNHTAQEARINGELQAAHEIQQSIIRKNLPEHDGIDVCAILRPAKEIGGDLYDYMTVGNKLYFVIADVSGKGVPAALVMAITMGMFRSLAHNGLSPQQIVSGINDTIAENNESNMFVTMFVGTISLNNGSLTYCNAGHNPPYMISDNGATALPVERNMAIGIMSGLNFKEQECECIKGKTLFTYTDGVTEAEDHNCNLFGEQRLADTLALTAGMTASDTVDRVCEAVATHVNEAPQSDDLTILCIKLHDGCSNCTTESRHLHITNNVAELHKLKDFVDDTCRRANADSGTCEILNLAMEEAVSNVVLYAYRKGVTGDIDISAEIKDNNVEFTITDSGEEFDPTEKEDADVSLPLEERPVGGLGIFIMKKTMDDVAYTRNNDQNVLRLRKHIGHKH